MKVTATGILNGHEITAEVVNPGDWFGKVWLIEIGGCYVPIFYAVEASDESTAIDEFTDSEFGHHIKVSEEDRADYNEENSTYAGNAAELVDLDHVAIHQIPLKYSCDRIPNGVPSAEYSAGKLRFP